MNFNEESNIKFKAKSEKRKAQSEKRKTKSEKRKAKSEKRKAKKKVFRKNWKKFEKCFNIFQFFSNFASSPTICFLPSTVAKNNLPNQYGVCMCRRRWTVTGWTKDVGKQFIQTGDGYGVDSFRENRLFFESSAIRASGSRTCVNTIQTMRPHS